MNAQALDDNKVIDINPDGTIKTPEPKAPEMSIMARHLCTVGDGALIERSEKLMREAVALIVDGEADKATITITLEIAKDQRDPQLFMTSGKAQLRTPIPKYSSATFIDKDAGPVRELKNAIHHTKATKKGSKK